MFYLPLPARILEFLSFPTVRILRMLSALIPLSLRPWILNGDQRSGLLLGIPTPPEAPPDPDKVRTRELLSIPRSNWTAAQRAELLELIALEITR